MEKIIETSSPNQTITYAGQNLKISLNIDNLEYNIPLDSLFDIAVRDNPKRRFLFVSKVLGKHIPIRPLTMRIIGALLARQWYEHSCTTADRELSPEWPRETSILVNALVALQSNQMTAEEYTSIRHTTESIINTPLVLDENTLFIGFAETATGIAQAVFSNFSNASYIHTTRENLEGMDPNFIFSEEHSHAVEHSLYTLDKSYLSSFDRIVLIDDELTTGKTAVNLMKNLPGNSFGLISILDWRSPESLSMFTQEKELSIRVCSLLKGTIHQIHEQVTSAGDTFHDLTGTMWYPDAKSSTYHKLCLTNASNINGYLFQTGRFGISDKDKASIDKLVQIAAEALQAVRLDGPCLCLGTEEFIYVPCMIANELGNDVFFHSTTRSPILSYNDQAYCIKNKVRFHSPQKSQVVNHVYNIPFGYYSQAIVFTEKPLGDTDTAMFRTLLNGFDIHNIVFVSWE